ncbi:ABC transporter permease [Uliginosibacterium sp. TH139]|uniref:ABC transporter permease n=1 Tax=Uliginosibacterium sp. TH139 TaxID=2067453 RepID=UPI000C7C9918|nr:ABC transporter permease [Uliginosibacterium sp. TH139]PLK50395.1 ABC transporter permease [Uliginosibacterium sp. TH139]
MSQTKLPGAIGALLAIIPAGLALSQTFSLSGFDPVIPLPALHSPALRVAALQIVCVLLAAQPLRCLLGTLPLLLGSLLTGALLLLSVPSGESEPATAFWLLCIAQFLLARTSVQRLAMLDSPPWVATLTAVLFGLWMLYFWQLLVTAFAVPRVLLPAPADILVALFTEADKLGGDFVQTVLKSVLTGYVLGSGLGIATGIAIERSPFLQRGLLPIASLTSTIPLVGVAPIAVMWFGFDWPSKVAVVVLMTFFPAMVSTLAGLGAAGKLERELMHSYAASPRQQLLALRLPAAMPFIFGALKVNASLALIGAIVAEFFGSPTAGLGFRISTEAARMQMPLVWAAIVLSAIVGSALYSLLVLCERRVNFWHPSVRAAQS